MQPCFQVLKFIRKQHFVPKDQLPVSPLLCDCSLQFSLCSLRPLTSSLCISSCCLAHEIQFAPPTYPLATPTRLPLCICLLCFPSFFLRHESLWLCALIMPAASSKPVSYHIKSFQKRQIAHCFPPAQRDPSVGQNRQVSGINSIAERGLQNAAFLWMWKTSTSLQHKHTRPLMYFSAPVNHSHQMDVFL